ncbi:uncharacterized protein LOC123885849 isoform X2 [Trifolium pratense]|nr:uncharacterized protein LOC123885849 isoform X2 [Trifolium pratense]
MGTFCDEIEANTKQVQKCSKKMEVDEGVNLNTVACLRGRLLAERQASKVAKEKAESMANKLVELEKLVKEEIKLRDKSERKLKFLRKKLESLSISSKSRQLGHSDSSRNCENSSGSSSSICSNSKFSKKKETQNCAKNTTLKENVVPNHNVSGTQYSSSTTKDCDYHITDNSSSNYSEHAWLFFFTNSEPESKSKLRV